MGQTRGCDAIGDSVKIISVVKMPSISRPLSRQPIDMSLSICCDAVKVERLRRDQAAAVQPDVL